MNLGSAYLYHEGLRRVGDEPPPPVYHAKVALEQHQITDRDIRFLSILADCHFLTKAQMRLLAFDDAPSERTMKKRLKSLTWHGVIQQVQWVEEDEPPRISYAYGLTMNGAWLLRDYFNRKSNWREGMGRRHLKVILSILAANEFWLQVALEQRELISGWRISTRATEPLASCRFNGRLLLIDTPRDSEDVWQLKPERYTKWDDQEPTILVIAPSPNLAREVFETLRESIPVERLVFSTDERAFEGDMRAKGYIWRWDAQDRVVPLALL